MMNRKHLFGLLAFLLVVPPLAMQGQSLTGYEYWFDGKVGSRVSRSLSGYEADINTEIETQHLSSGLHTLHMRFSQSGGEYKYSPVTSQLFFKHNAEEGGQIEYWFDNDVANSATVPLPSTAIEDTVDVALKMTDAIKFPLGFHQLNIRVATEGKSLSNIYTAHVLKVPSGEIDMIEYWVDNDFEHPKTVEGHVASYDDNMFIFVNPFDLSDVPSGPHRIYYRPASKNGKACGAVSMASVIVGGGTPSKIEYWFDGDVTKSATVDLPATALTDTVDVALVMNNIEKFPLGMHQLSMRLVSGDRKQSPVYSARVLKKASGKMDVIEYWVDDWVDEAGVAHPKTITGHTASSDENAFVFNNTFDLSEASEGYHRVYYRATSSTGKASSAVSMTPVMVKSRYNVDPADVQMTKYSIAVDNEEPAHFSFHHPGTAVDLDRRLDVRHLNKGNYQLNVKMTSSIGTSVSLKHAFSVEELPSAPLVTLTATEEKDLVNIRFNSVLSDNGYKINRVDANGVEKTIKFEKESKYPIDICYTDNPFPGDYTYYAVIPYTDINGEKQKAISNEVTVSVKKKNTDLGYVEGEIYYEGKRKVGFKSKIAISDAFILDGEATIVQSNLEGVFRKDKIPVGKEIKVSLSENDYYYTEAAIFTVKKGRNHVRLDVKKRTDCPNNEQMDYGSLTYYDRLTWEPGMYFKLPLINTSHEVWNGKICIKAYPKRYDNEEETTQVNPGAQVLPGSVASFQTLPFFETKTYQTFESQNFQLVYNGSKEVLVPLTGFYNKGDSEMYNFYVYCVKHDGSMSLVSPNNSFSSTRSNPMEFLMEGTTDSGDADETKSAFFTNLIVYYFGMVENLDKIIGKTKDVLGYGKEKLQHDYYKLTHATEEGIELTLEDEGMQGVVYDMIEKCDQFSSEVKAFRDDIAPIVKEAKSFNTLWGYVQKSVSDINDYSKTLASKNDCEKTVYLSKKIIDLAADSNPFTPILKKYLDIGETVINKVIPKIAWAYNEKYIPNDMRMMDHQKLKIKIRVVKKNGKQLNFREFPFGYGTAIIKDVLVKGWNNTKNDIAIASFKNVDTHILDWVDDVAVFDQYAIDDKNKLLTEVEFKQLWAEIYWSNGRVSYVPLIEDIKGVEYSRSEMSSIFTITFDSGSNDYNTAADIIRLRE